MRLSKRLSDNPNKSEAKYRDIFYFLDLLAEIVGWITIVISLTGFISIFGFIAYLLIEGKIGILIASSKSFLGLLFSIIYATSIWKTKGTINFISNSSWKWNRTDSQ